MAVADKIRAGFGLESAEDQRQKKRAEEAVAIYKYCAESKRRKEYEWFINDNFYNNNHYLKYNVGTRQIQQVPMSKLGDKISINKISQVVRGITSYLNKEHPTVAILPGIQADAAYERAKKEKHLVDYWYDHLQMNKKIKQITMDACKYGIGWSKILWDKEALSPTEPFTNDNGELKGHIKGEVMFERVDPFDVYPDPTALDMKSMRYIVHAIPRTIGEIKQSPLYMNKDKLTADNKFAASAIKQSQIRQALVNGQQMTPNVLTDLNTLIVLEVFKREMVDGEWKIVVVTTTETGVLLRDEIWPFDDFPFEYYQTEIASGVMNSHGVIRNIRELNRALNQQASQVLESSRIMGRLNWLTPRGSNVGVINDTTGQYIEYDVNPGGPPVQAHPANLPPYIQQNMQDLERWMDDIGGAHNAFYGKSPFSRASGELVNQLQEGDSNNLAMMRDNLDDFLVRTFKKMFATAKENYTADRSFRLNESDGMTAYRWMTIEPKDISLEDDIQVRSGTNMPYSLSQKQDMFLNMWKEKLIVDPKAILKLMELPDIDNVAGNDQADIERQLEENRLMIDGKDIDDPVVAEDHSVHIDVMRQLIRSPKFKTLNKKIQGRLLDHYMKHIDFSVQLAQIAASQNFEPIKRSEQINYRMNSMNEATPIERTQIYGKFGIQSDAAQIQQRGGVFVQDPEAAKQQAMLEDNEMLVDPQDPTEMSKPMMISPGDNHQVHLMVHSEAAASPGFKAQPLHAQKFMLDHIKQHEQALQSQTPAPGLVPNGRESLPQQPILPKRNASPVGQNNPVNPMMSGAGRAPMVRTQPHPVDMAADVKHTEEDQATHQKAKMAAEMAASQPPVKPTKRSKSGQRA